MSLGGSQGAGGKAVHAPRVVPKYEHRAQWEFREAAQA